jgi:hypothetical protein
MKFTRPVYGVISFSKQCVGIIGFKETGFYTYVCMCKDCYPIFDKTRLLNAKKWASKGLDIAIRDGFGYEELHIFRVMINNICFHTVIMNGPMNISTAGIATAENDQ